MISVTRQVITTYWAPKDVPSTFQDILEMHLIAIDIL